MSTVLVSGALANKPFNGGEAWVRLSWALGLKTLGCRVHFVEQIAPSACVDGTGAPAPFERSLNLAYFKDVTSRFGLQGSAALVYDNGAKVDGSSLDDL